MPTELTDRQVAAEIEAFRAETLAETVVTTELATPPSSMSFEDWMDIEFTD